MSKAGSGNITCCMVLGDPFQVTMLEQEVGEIGFEIPSNLNYSVIACFREETVARGEIYALNKY